ncbi:MAG: A/G-specific adenine glycosylase [Acidiferrobacterales bacterium]|nr:A/G-specific adenine glycosylase [Acidiferrobacterales bacterium]
MDKFSKDPSDSGNFSRMLLDWNCELPGRGLPWAFSTDSYRIWISEVMLQQTQAKTVVDYFERFVDEFPDVRSLADASTDHVMSLWAGLGYYTRARNLHAAAKTIRDQHHGKFPNNFRDVLALPGIGKSTAGAICALAYGLRTPILDGNAKRVYARYHCVDDDSESVRTRRLWQIAEEHTPKHDVQRYTQLIMDLGATVCTPKNPKCTICPLSRSCCAHCQHLTEHLPRRKASRRREVRYVTMLIITDGANRVLLQRRPDEGVWGNLWSFPEFSGNSRDVRSWCHSQLKVRVNTASPWRSITHDFTHLRLVITPQPANLVESERDISQADNLALLAISEAKTMGIPAPVRTLLTNLEDGQTRGNPVRT